MAEEEECCEKEEEAQPLLFVPTHQANDIEVFTKCLNLTNINIKIWIESLDLEKSEELAEVIDQQQKTGDMTVLLKPYLPFIKECDELQVQ